jgi:hypothetical protein
VPPITIKSGGALNFKRAFFFPGKIISPAGGGGAFSNENSVAFDGADDHIDVGNDSSLAPAKLTLSCWFKASGSIGAYNYLVSRNGNTYGAYHLRYTSGNKFNYFLAFAPGGGTHRQATFNSTFTLTDWHHVALTYDGSYIKGYVDGSEDYSIAETRALAYSADATYGTDTWIGKGKYSDPAQGLIDEVAVFSSALSSSDITAIYNGGVPADLTSLSPVGWWRMGDGTEAGSGTTIYDMSSNSNNGTLTNGPTFSSDTP